MVRSGSYFGDTKKYGAVTAVPTVCDELQDVPIRDLYVGGFGVVLTIETNFTTLRLLRESFCDILICQLCNLKD
jgi:hypothetical protein